MAEEQQPIDVSLVLPCLNEALTLPVCIRKAQAALAKSGMRGEIVIGDNGSTDGSQELARRLGARVIDVAERGYGSALRGAIDASKGQFIIMADSDDSYDWSDLMPFLQKWKEGFDFVMGNRFQGGIKPGAMPLLNRYLGNPVLSAVGRLFFRTRIRDFHCGMRGFSRGAYERMDLRTTGMEFASEMVMKASLFGLKTTEVPTTLSPDGRDRPPHLRRWRDGWRHLRFMLLYSPRWLFLYPGLLLMAVGCCFGIWLLPGPRKVGNVEFDVHTMLYAACAIILGYQAVLFSLFVKVFALVEHLIPEQPSFQRLFKWFSLEWGLVCGGLMVIAGVAGSLHAVLLWQRTIFGMLDPSEMLRLIIPSIMSLVLGCQTIFSSFFLSVLGLKRK